MSMTELFLAELDRESPGTRRALERFPDGRGDWRPHEKSMPLGRLAALVASMPAWTASMIGEAELNVTKGGGSQAVPATSRELVDLHERSVATAREFLSKTTDAHLLTTWRLVANGRVVSEQPRHIALRDGLFNHLAHHRGQLTVYLRLIGASVPSIYGPSADEGHFG